MLQNFSQILCFIASLYTMPQNMLDGVSVVTTDYNRVIYTRRLARRVLQHTTAHYMTMHNDFQGGQSK